MTLAKMPTAGPMCLATDRGDLSIVRARIGRVRVKRKWLVCLLALACGALVCFVGIARERYEVPCGFRGAVVIAYNHPGGRPIERTLARAYVYRVDPMGILRLSDPVPEEPFEHMRVVETCPDGVQEIEPLRLTYGSSTFPDHVVQWTAFTVRQELRGKRGSLVSTVLQEVADALAARNK